MPFYAESYAAAAAGSHGPTSCHTGRVIALANSSEATRLKKTFPSLDGFHDGIFDEPLDLVLELSLFTIRLYQM